jgi:hypothetical protein
MSTRSRKIMFLGSRARPVRRAENLTAICEPIVWTTWDPQPLPFYRAISWPGPRALRLCISAPSKRLTLARDSIGALFVSQPPDVSVAGQRAEQRRLSGADSPANCGIFYLYFCALCCWFCVKMGSRKRPTLAESAQNKAM